MAKNFDGLRAKMSPERRVRNQARTEQLLAGLRLRRLREERKITQQEIARELKRTQAAISQLEKREDIRLSTWVEYIEATGGQLVMAVRYPNNIEIPVPPFIADQENRAAKH